MSKRIEAILAAVPAECSDHFSVVRTERGESQCFWAVPTLEDARKIARGQAAMFPRVGYAIVHNGLIIRSANF